MMCDASVWIKLLYVLVAAVTVGGFWIGMLMYLDGYFEPERVTARHKAKRFKPYDRKMVQDRIKSIAADELNSFNTR